MKWKKLHSINGYWIENSIFISCKVVSGTDERGITRL